MPITSKALVMAISPRADRLAVVHGEPAKVAGRYDPLDYRLDIREISAGDSTIAAIPLGQLEPSSLHFLPDGKRLFFATGDGQFPNDIHVVDPAQENSIVTLEDVREVHAIAVAPDGEHLAITDGNSVRVWDVRTGRVAAQLPTGAYNYSIGFSPDGRYLATAAEDDDLTLWAWRTEDLIDRACGHLSRNLSPKEWQDFLPGRPYRPTCPNLPAAPVAERAPM